MQVVGRLGSYISRGVSTVSGSVRPLGGAVDIVLVEQQDGSFKSSPWYVRFGKSHGVLRTEERMISINVNGEEANFHMYMDHKGQAFFLREVEAEEGESAFYPLSSGDETDIPDKRHLKSRSFCFESDKSNYIDQGDMKTGNMLARTTSDGSVTSGLVIGDNDFQREVLNADIIAARSLECAEIAANLLEVKWSTNLAGHKPPRKDRVQFQKRKSQRDNMNNSSNERSLYDEVCSLNARDGLCSNPDLEVPGGFDEDNGICSSSSGTTVEVSFSKQKTEAITELPMSGDIAEDSEQNRKMKEVITVRTVIDLDVAGPQLDDSIENKPLSGEDVSGTRIMPGYGISGEEIPRIMPWGRGWSSATSLQWNVTKNEEVTKNADVMVPVTMVSQTSQQASCTHPSISKSIVVDVEDQTELLKTQTINLDIGLCSAEKDESNSGSTLRNQALEKKVVKVEEASSTLPHPKSSRDCVDEDKLFNSFHLSPESQTADPEKPIVTSSPTDVLNNKDGGDKNSEQSKSLSDSFHSLSNALGQHDVCHPSIHSMNSACNILKQPSFGKDDVKCLKPDEQLLSEESGVKDNNNLGDVKSTTINPPLGVSSAHKPSPSGNWKLWPFPFRTSSSEKAMVPAADDKDTNASVSSINKDADKNELKPKIFKKNVRAKTPTAEQLASLNLKEGKNTVTFTFSMDTLENEQVDAQIFLWKWNCRIVISDVDGTITKSDVLGQVMPLVGVDWSQTGVTHLFSAIKENGYKILFLSARSISQACQTRQFLVNLKQDGKVLPDGPVVISPDGIFPSLYREVIRRAPHEFKISCLEDIKALFPPDCNPFYAGFGNRDTDEISYLKVGIPRGKIFIINPKGEIVVNRQHDTKSYTSLHALVNGMFPPTNTSEQEDFNSWNYWKLPPPVLNN
ncbi:phosphatidate phosphatase PAH2-like [Neltuma alba]|uniref:phosphatidate phosphatase PAH2-like n=1 Tax=Neltuma alba TaxID=207710 RepID=UPI0010A41BF9|nr:phosphatidate phosphatase PAH2-like [Prosopis alba]